MELQMSVPLPSRGAFLYLQTQPPAPSGCSPEDVLTD